jgi:type I restriction enzyme, R subunit
MPVTDFSEAGLEIAIAASLTGLSAAQVKAAQGEGGLAEPPVGYDAGWLLGNPHDYDRVHFLDVAQLMAFLDETQPQTVAQLGVGQPGLARRRFLERIQG